VADRSRLVQPLDAPRVSGQLVAVTTWVHPDVLLAAPVPGGGPLQALGPRNPYAVGGLVVVVAVVATLVVCLVIALLALVAWVTAHGPGRRCRCRGGGGDCGGVPGGVGPGRSCRAASGGCCR